MTDYTTTDIRNVALMGHGGAGKTSLAEAMLHTAGVVESPGTIERGDTLLDYSPQEKEHRHTLESAVASVDFSDVHINLIDTPGYPDLLPRALAVMPAVETVAVVINAERGVEPVTRRVMAQAKARGLDRFLIVNRIDAPDVDCAALLEQLQENFGSECLPLNLPGAAGGVVDCFFTADGEATTFSSAAQAHERIVDQVVELDEELMELYLEQGAEVTPEQLHEPFEAALRDDHLVPVCFVSATTGAGVSLLLRILSELMPNPREGNPPVFLKGPGADPEEIQLTTDAAAHALAHVFKIAVDPFVGKMGVFRVHQGTVRKDSQLYVGDGRKPFKVTHLYQLQGREQQEIDQAVPGDICAVARVDELCYDAVLHDSHDEDEIRMKPVPLPAPMYGLAIEARARGEEQKISDALSKLLAEDPGLRLDHEAAVNETVLRGASELHLRLALEKLSQVYKVEVDTRLPRVPYRETVTRSAEGHYRHKKQTGGAGQFGEVFLRVEPLARGAGYEFVDEVVGGVIPKQFLPAVDKGVQQALAQGAVAGFPLQDLRVVVHDGKYHAVDSKEVAFVAAGKRAFLEAVEKAAAVVLEPIVSLEVTAPGDKMGDINADLATRRGRINDTGVAPSGDAVIRAEVPLSELDDYASTLKSLTADEGSYAIEFNRYEPVPGDIQARLAEGFAPDSGEG